jgi:hypothetical protein
MDGCLMDVFVKHIEKQFKEGMSWDNYGRSSSSGGEGGLM